MFLISNQHFSHVKKETFKIEMNLLHKNVIINIRLIKIPANYTLHPLLVFKINYRKKTDKKREKFFLYIKGFIHLK